MNEPASQHIPKPSAVAPGRPMKENSISNWINSPETKNIHEELQKAHQESIERSVGWYHMLSSEDKYKAVEALCYIICKAEKEGTSHRGLMNELGVYPEAFWISDLMTIHNAVWTEYQELDSKNYTNHNKSHT
jgi:hypothetical protein